MDRSALAISNGILQAMASTAQETASDPAAPGFWSGKTVAVQLNGYKNGYNHNSSLMIRFFEALGLERKLWFGGHRPAAR